jgi:hypothetical protein
MVYVYIDLGNPYIYYAYHNPFSKYGERVADAYNNHPMLLVSMVIIILAVLMPRRLLGVRSRAIRVTARNKDRQRRYILRILKLPIGHLINELLPPIIRYKDGDA